MYTVYCSNGIIDERFVTRREVAEFIISQYKKVTGEPLTDKEKNLFIEEKKIGLIEEVEQRYALTVTHYEDEDLSSGILVFIGKDDNKMFTGLYSNVVEGVK